MGQNEDEKEANAGKEKSRSRKQAAFLARTPALGFQPYHIQADDLVPTI
jgi:hypothetical protein